MKKFLIGFFSLFLLGALPASAEIRSSSYDTTTRLVYQTDLLYPAGDGTAAAPAYRFGLDANTGIYRPGADQIGFAVNGAGELLLTATALSPVTSDGLALGTSSLMWSDLFGADGFTLNLNNGDVVITHSLNTLTITGGNLVAPIGSSTVDASGFNGNLTTTDDTVQEIAQKLDDLATGAGSGDVTAASAFGTDNRLVRSDGTAKGVQASLVDVDDSGNLTTSGTITAAGFVSTGAGNTVSITEGATADAFETTLQVVDPTADRTITFPDADGTVALVAGNIGAAIATTASAGDSDTSVATTAFVQTEVDETRTGSHASPSTTTPLSPTWNGPLHTVYYNAAGTINLPAASTYAGRAICVYNTSASNTITIDPNGTEVIVREGTAQTGGVSMTLSSGAGNFVFLMCDGTRWITMGKNGTLAVGS